MSCFVMNYCIYMQSISDWFQLRCRVMIGVQAVAQLVEGLRYEVAGSIPDGVIGIFH